MKKLLLLATLVLGVVSCMKDQPIEAGLTGDGNIVLSVGLPADVTRAMDKDSSKGAIGNIDLAEYDIRYILEVFDAHENLAKRVEKYEDTATETTFELRLIPGRHYSFVVWADFVKQGTESELHYDASDLRNIEVIGAQNAMDESRDAYTAVFNTAKDGDKEKFSSASTISMTLRRPFAKLRVVTNDMQEIYSPLQNAKVVYTSQIYNMYDALESEPSNAVSVEKEYNFDATTAYANEAADNCPTKTLFADYLLGTETGSVQFVMTITDDVETLDPIAFNTNIPVERNHLTTIYGPVLTDFNKVTVTIDDDFTQPEHIVDVWDGVSISEPTVEADPVTGEPVAVIDSASDLAWLAQYVNGTLASTLSTRGNDVKNFVLTADVDLDNHPWTPIGSADADHGFMGNFDGNNHVIKNLNIVDTNGGYVGLFGVTEGQADSNHNMISENRVANFTLENVNIVSNGDIVAAVIAYPYYTNVENITVKGNVNIKGRDYTAGVLAYTRRCVNVNNIAVEANEGSVVEGRITVGGIISDIQTNGGLKANYSNFAVSGLTVKGSKMVGGISGIICNQTLNGAVVENVTIVCDDVRKGAISGALGGASVITEAEVNNVAGAERLIGSTYDSGDECTVTINGVVYEYLASGAYKVDGKVVVDNNDQFQSAIAAGETSIVLGKGAFNLPSSLVQKEGTLTIIGAGVEETILNGAKNANGNAPGNYANGVNLVFEGLTFKTANNGYNGGFGHAVSVTFRESKIVGQFYAHSSAPHYFYDCTIDPLTGYLYTYASDCVFEGCTFAASEGKALQIYEDAASGENTVTITNCAFVAAKQAATWDGKPVTGIDINSNGAKFEVYINNCTTTGFPTGLNSNSDLWNVKDAGKAHVNVYVDGAQVWFAGFETVAEGLLKKNSAYIVMNAEGLAALNAMMVNKTAGTAVKVTLGADIDFAGKTWTPVDSHVDTPFYFSELNGNGYTISNLTINGQAMFTRFAGSGNVTIKDVTFDNAKVNSNALNTSILTVQSYQNVLLDNVDVKNSTIVGAYKVAPLIATVYNEGASTITATLKNCDVENTVVKATSYDFCTTGMVAFVNEGDNDRVEFENCSVKDVQLYAPNAYTAHAAIYTAGSETLYNEVEGVVVENVTFENI